MIMRIYIKKHNHEINNCFKNTLIVDLLKNALPLYTSKECSPCILLKNAPPVYFKRMLTLYTSKECSSCILLKNTPPVYF